MADCAVAHDGLAFDDFGDDVQLFIRHRYTDAFANRSRVATDCEKLTVAVHANRDVPREAQDAFPARFNGNASMTSPAEH